MIRPLNCPDCGSGELRVHCTEDRCDWVVCPKCHGFGTDERWAKGHAGPSGREEAS